MSEPNAELDELRRRVEEQSQRIEELQDALHTLRVIHSRDDRLCLPRSGTACLAL